MSVLALLEPPGNDPAALGYPPTLPLELALKTASIPELCNAYGITREEWNELRFDQALRADVLRYREILKEEGMSFKLKARLQAEELLKTSWKMIHTPGNDTPAAVRADLIKFTIRAAGLDGSEKSGAGAGNNLQININLG